MKRAVVYYRTRPSEPEASEIAFRLQREAVREYLVRTDCVVASEFIEREGENVPERYPEFIAAAQAAYDLSPDEIDLDAELIIASNAAIGTGEPFYELEYKSKEIEYKWPFCQTHLFAASIPTEVEITVTDGAPAPLCLQVMRRRDQRDDLIYLCNADSLPILNGVCVVTTVSWDDLNGSENPEEIWARGATRETRWGVLSAGCGIHVDRYWHIFFTIEEIQRYQVRFEDSEGRIWSSEAYYSGVFDDSESDIGWIAFSQPLPTDAAK